MIKNVLITIAFLAGISGFVISMLNLKTNTVYIDMGKIYENFGLSKELNKSLDSKIKRDKNLTDSLYQQLRIKTKEVKDKQNKTEDDINYLARLEEEFYYNQQTLEKEVQSVAKDNDAKIWNQLNQYIQDFGKENKYTFILGANGQGTIMYADNEKDVTNVVIEYVNNRYNGIINK